MPGVWKGALSLRRECPDHEERVVDARILADRGGRRFRPEARLAASPR